MKKEEERNLMNQGAWPNQAYAVAKEGLAVVWTQKFIVQARFSDSLF
jgi:hypothetical protein